MYVCMGPHHPVCVKEVFRNFNGGLHYFNRVLVKAICQGPLTGVGGGDGEEEDENREGKKGRGSHLHENIEN